MTGKQFVDEMTASLRQLLAVRDAALARLGESVGRADMPQLLRGALRNELEAAEIAARWVPETDDLECKLAFARQAGDEARHYQLVAERLCALSPAEAVDARTEAPFPGGHSRLYRYHETLRTTVERVAATQFTREAIGHKSNELFIAFCEACGDRETAAMYRTGIQPDEQHHHDWGRRLLERLATGPEEQAAARQAILKTLELAEELRSLAAGRLLVEALPGC